MTPTMPAWRGVSTFISVSQTALYSQVVCFVGGSGQPQGSASAIVIDGVQSAASSPQQPKGSCKFLFENHPSGFSPHLDDVGLSWDWVVDAMMVKIIEDRVLTAKHET